jgi:putative endonuclease
MASHIETGKKGESLAADFLLKKGYKILETNWHYGHKEIDIIAMEGNMLVIVEVKTRSTDYFGYPEEAVNKKKQEYLIKAADAYVYRYDLPYEVRYDIIAIILNGNDVKIHHIEDAFFPGL